MGSWDKDSSQWRIYQRACSILLGKSREKVNKRMVIMHLNTCKCRSRTTSVGRMSMVNSYTKVKRDDRNDTT